MDNIPSIASYVLERPAFGAFSLSLVGLIAVGWYAVQRHDESKPIKLPTRALLVVFTLGTVLFAGIEFWPRQTTDVGASIAPTLVRSLPAPDNGSSPPPVEKQQVDAVVRKNAPRPEARRARDQRVGPNAWGLVCFNRPFASITDEQQAIDHRCKTEGDPRILDDLFYNTEADARAAATMINACVRRSDATYRCEPEYRP